MCNAYGLRAPIAKIIDAFSEVRIPLRFETAGAPNLPERDPIRPTETASLALPDGATGAVFREVKWGFAPPRPKTPPVINFRSEGRRFATGSRVLILASWFYEFTGDRYPKTRWRFSKPDADAGVEDPFAIAGLIRGPGGTDAKGKPWPESFTMLTVEPGPDVAPIHNRQIVVLDRALWGLWLHSEPEVACGLLKPSPRGALVVTEA